MSYPDKNRILKVLDKIEKGKIKPTQIINENATPMDKMKFNICQGIIRFKREHNYTNKEIGIIIDVGAAVVSRITHCQIEKFKIDSLLKYYFCLIISSKDSRLVKKFNKELAGFLKDKAA